MAGESAGGTVRRDVLDILADELSERAASPLASFLCFDEGAGQRRARLNGVHTLQRRGGRLWDLDGEERDFLKETRRLVARAYGTKWARDNYPRLREKLLARARAKRRTDPVYRDRNRARTKRSYEKHRKKYLARLRAKRRRHTQEREPRTKAQRPVNSRPRKFAGRLLRAGLSPQARTCSHCGDTGHDRRRCNGPPLSPTQVAARAEERRRRGRISLRIGREDRAAAAGRDLRPSGRCAECGERGHYYTSCPRKEVPPVQAAASPTRRRPNRRTRTTPSRLTDADRRRLAEGFRAAPDAVAYATKVGTGQSTLAQWARELIGPGRGGPRKHAVDKRWLAEQFRAADNAPAFAAAAGIGESTLRRWAAEFLGPGTKGKRKSPSIGADLGASI